MELVLGRPGLGKKAHWGLLLMPFGLCCFTYTSTLKFLVKCTLVMRY